MAKKASTQKRSYGTRTRSTKSRSGSSSKSGYRRKPYYGYRRYYRQPKQQVASAPANSWLGDIGQRAGGFVGNLASKWLGMGEYVIEANTIVKPSSVPIMHSDDSSIRVRHKEFIRDVTATATFNSESLSVNPGLSSTFPFLSGLAQSYEMYRIHGLVFTFKSNSANALNSTNTALGTIVLASDYNVLDSSFASKQEMESTTFSNSGKPSEDILHPIECAPKFTSNIQRFVRSGGVSTGDLRLYDWCNFQIGSVGVQATSVVGELWVSYDIEMFNPQLTVPRGLNIPCAKFQLQTITNAAPLGVDVPITDINTIGVTFTSTVISIPANNYGVYELQYDVLGSNTASLALSLAFTTNITGVKVYDGNTLTNFGNDGDTFTRYIRTVVFKLTSPLSSGVITLSGATLPTSAVYGNLFITAINGQLG